MELPILYAFTYPDRVPDAGVPPFDPVTLSPLQFEPVRRSDFPALDLGISAGRSGGVAPAVFNAANEQAVACFLAGTIRFGDVPRAIESALAALGTAPGGSLDAVLTADAAARRHVQELFGC
jgi:1-deoxy-D-xylulose-5-phosphate reductoisomerase